MLGHDITALLTPDVHAHTPVVMSHRGTWNAAFAGNGQQDAHEAFQSLMDACDEVDSTALRTLPAYSAMNPAEFRMSPARASTPYNRIFGNLQIVRTTCGTCHAISSRYERAHSHSLSLAQEEQNAVDVLLTGHLGHERLDENWLCEQCQTRGNGTKSTEVLHWPPVLVATLKRFQFDMRSRVTTKIQRHIDYPMHWPISAGITYHLRAVIQHQGGSSGGHYVAYVRAEDNTWYFFNDSARPRRIRNPMDVLRQQAYTLFYEL